MTFPSQPLSWQIFLILIAIIGTARLTKLGTEDNFPPVRRLRDLWVARFNDSDWAELAFCPFCQSMYFAAFTLLSGILLDFGVIWITFYSWLSLAYTAAIIVARDIPDRE